MPWSRRSGTSCGRGCSPTTPSRPCAPGSAARAAVARPPHTARRRPRAATPSSGRAGRRCPAAAARPRSAAGGRSRRPASPTPPAARTPAPRRSWNGTACSPAARWAPSGSAAGSPPSTGCCGRWRTPAGPAAATSSKGSARHSSRCRARSTGCGRCLAPTAAATRPTRAATARRAGSPGWCWPPPIPPSPTARRCPGPPRSARRRTGRGARRGRSSVLVDGAPALYVERGGRSLLSFTDRARRAARRGTGAGRRRARGLAGHPGRRAGRRRRLAGLRSGRRAHRSGVPRHAEGVAAARVTPGCPALPGTWAGRGAHRSRVPGHAEGVAAARVTPGCPAPPARGRSARDEGATKREQRPRGDDFYRVTAHRAPATLVPCRRARASGSPDGSSCTSATGPRCGSTSRAPNCS